MRTIATTLALLLASSASAQRVAGRFDAYGYEIVTAGPSCPAAFVDISTTGTPIVPTAGDDGAAVVALALPFEFYGVARNSVVASTNGYLAVADSLAIDAGTDFSNDCPLPALPDGGRIDAGSTSSGPAHPGRIMVYHDDLDATAGAMHAQHFAPCPRPAGSGVPEACTIVQWTGLSRIGTPGPVDAQAILYHGSFEIAMLYRALDAGAGAGATIALQNDDATSTALYGCDGESVLAAGSAVCFLAPAGSLPTISDVPDTTISEDASIQLDFTVSASVATVTAASSNTTLIDAAELVVGGAGTARTLTVTPKQDQNGTATITLTAEDGSGRIATDTFLLTVTNVNDAPTVAAPPAQRVASGASTGTLGVTVGDLDDAAGSLVLAATSSNPAIAPDGNVTLAGSGTARTVTVQTVAGATGTTTITLTVTDGSNAASSASFDVTADPDSLFDDGFE